MQHFSSLTNTALVALLQQGDVGVLPTDTVYGIVARATDKVATTRLYTLKDREHKPGTLIAADTAQLVMLGLDQDQIMAVAHYWPGSISCIVDTNQALNYLDQGVGSLAVRIPDDGQLRALLKLTGPLITSSANTPGQPPATNLAEAYVYFGTHVDFYVDGGDRSSRAPSTIVRVVNGRLQVIRAGAVKVEESNI